MTEDIVNLRGGFGSDLWRISGHDAEVIRELHQVIRAWLPAFETGAEVIAAGRALRDLELLAEHGGAPDYCEIEMEALDEAGCGTSVSIGMGGDDIMLSVVEFVPGPNGIPDHFTPTDRDGQPIGLTLDSMGSFDRDSFDAWWHRAMDIAPADPIQPNVKASIKRDDL